MSVTIEMERRRFGRLVVMARAARCDSGRAYWACVCDCGAEAVVLGKSLRQGLTTSCGCAQRDVVIAKNYKHGGKRSKEYRAWTHIKGRCLNPSDHAYANYGGRGITICRDWVDDFPAFLAHIGRAPHPSMTVERIDNERGYEPGNIRWATRHDQTRNTRRNVRLPNGLVLADACTLVGANHRRAGHLVRRGVAPEVAVEAAR